MTQGTESTTQFNQGIKKSPRAEEENTLNLTAIAAHRDHLHPAPQAQIQVPVQTDPAKSNNMLYIGKKTAKRKMINDSI